MDVEQVADALVARAANQGQAVLRCNETTPVEDLRAAVRRVAGRRGINIRTGMVSEVLAVVLANAGLWDEPVSVMRDKLPTPITFNTVH